MVNTNNLTIFVSGVSSGIGRATAEYFLNMGHTVIGTVRKIEDADFFKNQYVDNFHVFVGDLTHFENNLNIIQLFEDKNIHSCDVVVHNAGLAVAGPIEYQNFAEVQHLMNLNVLSVIQLTQILLPYLKKAKKPGRIINISSVSGVGGTPFLGAYCATKHAIEGLSESLRRELRLYGMKVIVIGPGSIKTPIWDKGFSLVSKLYQQTEYAQSFQKFIDFASHEKDHALDVSEVVYFINKAVFSKNPCLRYAPVPRKLINWYLPKIIPKKIYDYLMCRALDLIVSKKDI